MDLAMFILANNINGRCYTIICRGQELEHAALYYYKRVHATSTRIRIPIVITVIIGLMVMVHTYTGHCVYIICIKFVLHIQYSVS